METTQTTNRIHPIMAAAAASVIIVSLTGAAAITGLLPTSKSAPEPMANQQQLAAMAAASPYAMQSSVTPAAGVQGQAQVAMPQMAMPAAAQLVATAQPVPVAYAQPQPAPQPAVIVKERIVEKPVVKVVEKTRVVHAAPKQTNYEEPRYQPAPAPAPAQPNYVGIGTGAVIGGLIGNQIGGGNGKKLATVAGIIGGGMIGNEVANRNR